MLLHYLVQVEIISSNELGKFTPFELMRFQTISIAQRFFELYSWGLSSSLVNITFTK